MKTIKCPHCRSTCEIGIGYYHDKKLNIRCNACDGVLLATNEEDEKDLIKLYARPVKECHENISAQTSRHYAHAHPHLRNQYSGEYDPHKKFPLDNDAYGY